MDIKVKKYFYALKLLPKGKYFIHQREEIMSPMISVIVLDTPTFDKEEDAQRFVDVLNEQEKSN